MIIATLASRFTVGGLHCQGGLAKPHARRPFSTLKYTALIICMQDVLLKTPERSFLRSSYITAGGCTGQHDPEW